MNRFAAIAAAAGLASLAACSNGPTDGPTANAPDVPRLAAGGNSGPSASGGGHVHIGDDLRTFSFTAVTHRDGSVTGQAQLYNRSTDTRLHLDIDCLRVVGTLAYVSGVVTESSSEATPPGFKAYFTVQDNGEGNDDAPDLISLVTLADFFPPNLCTFNLPAPTLPVERGNVQVQP